MNLRLAGPILGILIALALTACSDTGGGEIGPPTVRNPAPQVPTSGESVETLMRMGDFTLARGDALSAIALYNRAHDLEPLSIVPLMRMGAAQAQLGSYEESAGAYRAVLQISPVNADAQRGLGNALVALNRPAEALPHLETALAIGNDLRAYNSIGVALDMLGRHADAQFYYRQGLAVSPVDLDLRTNLALSLSLTGQNEEAIRLLREVAGAPNATVRHRQNLALALVMAGRMDEARTVSLVDFNDAQAQRNLQHYATLRSLPSSGARAAAIGGGGAISTAQ